jgi:hypothetical protein
MNGQTIGTLFVITMFEIPLIISLWLLVKSVLVKIDRIRSLNNKDHDSEKDITKVILLSIVILILFALIVFPIVIVIVPDILLGLPLPVRLFILFGFIIIYMPIYGCFFALFRGLGDVVGAGGSASKTIKQLSEYIYEALEINQKNNNYIKK